MFLNSSGSASPDSLFGLPKTNLGVSLRLGAPNFIPVDVCPENGVVFLERFTTAIYQLKAGWKYHLLSYFLGPDRNRSIHPRERFVPLLRPGLTEERELVLSGMRLIPILGLSLATLFLLGCADSGTGGTSSAATVKDLSSVKMPVLRSAYLENAWGAPYVSVENDGTYLLRYRQGDTLNMVIIRSLTKLTPAPEKAPDWEEGSGDPAGPAPVKHSQSWMRTTILGKTVKWYQNDGGGGADFPAYRTVDFALTAPDGRSGFYSIEVCSDSKSKAANWINQVSW